MTRVAPFKESSLSQAIAAAVQHDAKDERWQVWVVVGGLAYVVGSLVASGVYLVHLQPSVANDYWWPNLNSTGTQTFLGDVYNAHLSHARTGDFPLFDQGLVYSTKTYATDASRIEWSASYGRQLLLDNIALDVAVSGLRKRTLEANFVSAAAYCWLDFNRTFAMAHTFKRQRRCDATKRANAAVYLEALTRNCVANAMYTATQSPQINSTLFSTLRQSVEGRWWLHALDTHTFLSVSDEAAYWAGRGLFTWKSSLQNLYHDGIDDTISIRNALGFEQAMQIKKLFKFGRSLGTWSTLNAYDGIWNDLYICEAVGCSILLHANDSLVNLGLDWDKDVLFPPNTVGADLVRQHIGPFMSIDVEWVAPPLTLRASHRKFQKTLASLYPDSAALPSGVLVDPVPSHWKRPSRLFYGGNPMCPFGVGRPFVQLSFGYYDDCTRQVPHQVDISRDAALFAIHVMAPLSPKSLAFPCNLCSLDVANTCTMFWQSLIHLQHDIAAPTSTQDEIHQAVWAVDIKFVQLAADNTSTFVLSQPMVPIDSADTWALFGWAMMYDWLQGDREVYRFEGDEGAVTLLSERHPQVFSMVANPMELPSHACKYIWYISVYTTFAMAGVGALMAVYALVHRLAFDGRHLLQFNRVVGSVWIGRPMLVVRGMTAIVILSTVPLSFVKTGEISLLLPTRRSFLASCLVAGEATWLTYVVQDIAAPLVRQGGRFVPMSSILVWVVLFMHDQVATLPTTSTIEPRCVIEYLGLQVQCESGVVEIGSLARCAVLCAISGAIPVALWCAAWLYGAWKRSEPAPLVSGPPALVPSVATSSLRVDDDGRLDPVASVMCGMLQIRHAVFDIKLWRLFPKETAGDATRNDPSKAPPSESPFQLARWRLVGLACLGLLYMVCTVFVSYSYLVVTESTMANDFWWASFNSTGHQSFLTNWFIRQLLLSSMLQPTQIDQVQYGDVYNSYGSKRLSITTTRLYPATIQDEVLSNLHVVVQGLRGMDSCDLPWIAASYCYVDFGQTWEMAVSAGRQDKCRLDQNNGAVYLESILRNADWTVLSVCWGEALTSGVFEAVGRTSKGQEWVAAMTSDNLNSMPDEVATWLSFNVTAYSPNWQNYKQLGVTETMDIQNAFGLAYPLTTRKIPSINRAAASSTSFRMQWPLAKLLWATSSNSSGLVGASLVRASPAYMFANSSSVDGLLARNGTLHLPLGQGLALTRLKFGPFGTTSMKRLAPPSELRHLYAAVTDAITTSLGQNGTSLQRFFDTQFMNVFTPDTVAWRGQDHAGGNFLCGTGTSLKSQLSEYLSLDGSCSQDVVEQTMQVKLTFMAALATQSSRSDKYVQDACAHETYARSNCIKVWRQGMAFLASAMVATQLTEMGDAANATKRAIRAAIDPQVVQYVSPRSNPSNVVLANVGLFDEPTFELFAWLYMFEWVLGSREVVRFDGVVSSMTIVSGRPLGVTFEVNAQEIPQNVAYYIRCAMQYLTMVLLSVAVVVCLMIASNRGFVEGINMFEFNRVAGVVWAGRPLMLVRGVTAICILSTATLHLVEPDGRRGFTQLKAVPRDSVSTMLSCGEMAWVVYILNDLLSVVTREATPAYSWKATNSVWLAAGVWSLVSPVQHVVHIDRECVTDVVDFAMTCRGGVLEIGSMDRFIGLLLLACASCVGFYWVELLLSRRRTTSATRHSSFLLHGVAYYQFSQTQWTHGGVYYLDRASAVLNGLVSVRVPRGPLLGMDVKTWHIFRIPDSPAQRLPPTLARAIPLMK